jgi:hypothetical protein
MPIDYQKEGRVALLTINHPDILNALSMSLHDGLGFESTLLSRLTQQLDRE